MFSLLQTLVYEALIIVKAEFQKRAHALVKPQNKAAKLIYARRILDSVLQDTDHFSCSRRVHNQPRG